MIVFVLPALKLRGRLGKRLGASFDGRAMTDGFSAFSAAARSHAQAALPTAAQEWYAERIVTAGFQPLSKEDEADFRTQFAGRLRPDQIDLLVKWHREEIAPKLLKARQGQR